MVSAGGAAAATAKVASGPGAVVRQVTATVVMVQMVWRVATMDSVISDQAAAVIQHLEDVVVMTATVSGIHTGAFHALQFFTAAYR